MSHRFLILSFWILLPSGVSAQEHFPDRVILKLDRPAMMARHLTDSPLDRQLRVIGASGMTPVLGAGESVRLKGLALPDDLERTFEVRYVADLDPEFVAAKLRILPGVAYAEPVHIHRTQYVPNDSLHNSAGQDFHAQHRIEQAWDLSKSSSGIVIAIVDSGTDYTHPDLAGNLWRNPSPGLAATLSPLLSHIVNDTIGWNFWNSGPITSPIQNADPRPNGSSHGTHVAGLAAAVTDNRIGISGTGFRSRYIVVRAGGTVADPNSIGFGYLGILYAALNGADVINASFGGTSYSHFGADVVALANALGSVVVAAAGNTGTETSFYPASFPEALSVGSVTSAGIRSSFSSHGYDVDVMARGNSLLSTVFNGNYALNTGTSMASPVVAGIVALVRHRFPDWSPDRVRHQIRSAANPAIYDQNTAFRDRLGNGLLDARKAVETPLPGIRVEEVAFLGPTGAKLGIGESGTMRVRIRNVGTGTQSLTVLPSALSAGISVGGGSAVGVGVLPEADTITLTLSMRIEDTFNTANDPLVKLTFSDPTRQFADFRVIRFDGFLIDTLRVNRLHVSFAANGTIGYSDAFSSLGGIGVIPQPLRESVLFEGGLMVSAETDRGEFVINQVRGTHAIESHFRPTSPFILRTPGTLSDADGRSAFQSTGFPAAPRIQVTFDTYAFAAPDIDRVVFLRYTVRNVSDEVMRNVRVGLYVDWDIGKYDDNNVAYSASDSILYAYSPQETATHPYMTLAHLGPISSVMAIDNAYEGPTDSLNFGTYFTSGSNVFNGFTRQEKAWSLRAGTRKTSVSGTDIAAVTATGPFTIHPNQHIVVGYVLAFGETLALLRAQVAASRALRLFHVTTVGGFESGPPWVEHPTRAALLPNYPNPFNPSTVIRFTVPEPMRAKIELFDAIGRRVRVVAEGSYEPGEHRLLLDASGLASGAYRLRLTTDAGTDTRTVTLIR